MEKVVVPGDLESTVRFAADNFIATAKECIESRGYCAIALSGGSTPKRVYERLARDHVASIDWSKVLLFFSDERVVPLDHLDSNYKMAMEGGFSSLPIPKAQIFPVQTGGDLALDAREYEILILTKIPEKKIDLMLLGIGEDGHTASLFPHTEALHITDRLYTPNFIPDKNVWRQTATYPLINGSRKIVVWAFGASKAEILKKVLQGPYQPDTYPIQGVGTEGAPVTFIVDNAAWK